MSDTPHYVECCNVECGWSGLSDDTVHFKHDDTLSMCPECHEVCEPVDDPSGR